MQQWKLCAVVVVLTNLKYSSSSGHVYIHYCRQRAEFFCTKIIRVLEFGGSHQDQRYELGQK